MKKFFVYSVGVFSWLNSVAVQASEKFEILPDLPEPLAYATQPVHAAAVSGSTDVTTLGAQSIGHEPSLISVVLSLLFVILLIYLTGIIYAKLNKVGLKTLKNQQGNLAKSQVAVLSTTQLGSNKTLHVVELDGKRMLIGASSSAIQLIKDLGSTKEISCDDNEYSHIEIPNIKIPKIEIPKIEIPTINFSKLVTKTHKPIENIENGSEEVSEDLISDKNTTTDSVSEKEEASETIIDTLFSQEKEIIQEAEEESTTKSEHVVDPEDFALYKKYLS